MRKLFNKWFPRKAEVERLERELQAMVKLYERNRVDSRSLGRDKRKLQLYIESLEPE